MNTHIVSKLPTFTEEDFNALKSGEHLKTEIKMEVDEEDNEADSMNNETNPHNRVVQDGHITSNSDLPTAFSIDAKIHVPLDISSAELLDMCSKRVERPADFKAVFEENVAPPQPPTRPPKEEIKVS